MRSQRVALGEARSQTAPSAVTDASREVAKVFRWSDQPKIALRMERKGRGGKTVTVISGVAASHSQEACKEMKKALGVGVRSEGEDIIVQGDQRDRLRTWLSSEGVKQIVG